MLAAGRPLQLDPDRLLPADPGERVIARRLYTSVRDQPVISPHGHVDPRLLLDDRPFADPAALFVTPDHYVTRLLHASGVRLDALGVGQGTLSEDAARRVWRLLCEHWDVFRGTPTRYWLESELAEIFQVTLRPAPDTADTIYDQVAARLAEPSHRPRALYERFRIRVLSATTDPCDDLSAYAALAADPSWSGRFVPTFRPDRLLEPDRPDWTAAVAELGEVAGIDTSGYTGYLRALEQRRRHFIDHGATSADHGHADARTDRLTPGDAERIHRAAVAGEITAAEATAFRRHMLWEMARMSCEDGLVMTLHCGVRRDHHLPTRSRFGTDVGADIPLRIEFTDALRPLLTSFGTHPGFHLVVFTVDETTWSSQLAPLAGFYPSVYVGVPWWFLDAPEAMRRFHSAVTESAGFSRISGFVDDTRAFCSIPARHDMFRRIEAGVLARLVAEHRLEEDEAADAALGLVAGQPAAIFKL